MPTTLPPKNSLRAATSTGPEASSATWEDLSAGGREVGNLRALEQARAAFRRRDFDPNRNDLEDAMTRLSMNESRLFTHGELVHSGGLGNCVGIVLLEKGSGKAFAAHSLCSNAAGDARDMATEARKLFNASKVQIYLFGNDERDLDPSAAQGAARAREIRRGIFDVLTKELGFTHSQIKAEWGKPQHTSVYIVDTESGVVKSFQTRNFSAD